MQLCFANSCPSTLWVAVMWWDPDSCQADGGDWATRGWWGVSPGGLVSTNVFTNNRYFYFFAEADDGLIWAGPYGPVECTDAAFDSCQVIGSTADYLSLSMRQVDTGPTEWDSVIVDLEL